MIDFLLAYTEKGDPENWFELVVWFFKGLGFFILVILLLCPIYISSGSSEDKKT